MPSFNHAPFLPTAIESVLAQTYPSVELVIVDDGSADKSLEIAQGYASRYPGRVKVFSHDGNANRGVSATGNLALAKSAGPYWCGLSSDDAFIADKVERQVRFLEEHPAVGMVYGRATVIDDTGRIVGPGYVRDLSREPDPIPRLLQDNCIWGQTAMIRRECFEKVGLHDESLMYSDWELWIRIAAHYRIAFLPSPVAYYRIHATNSSLGQPVDVHLARHLDVMRALERKAPGTGGGLARPFNRALIELQLAYLYFCANDESAAIRAIKAAFEIDPSVFRNVQFLAGWLRRRQADIAAFMTSPAQDFLPWFAEHTLPTVSGLALGGTSFSDRWRLQSAFVLAKWGVIARRIYWRARGRASGVSLRATGGGR
jgi:GT2 family glycosyltransferase